MHRCDTETLLVVHERGWKYHEPQKGTLFGVIKGFSFVESILPEFEIIGEYAGHQYLVEYYSSRGPVVYRWDRRESKFWGSLMGWKRLSKAPMPLIDTWRKLTAGAENYA